MGSGSWKISAVALVMLLLFTITFYPNASGTEFSPLPEDNDPPTVTNIYLSGNMTTGDPMTLYVLTSDNVNISSVWLVHNWTVPRPSSWKNVSMTGASNNYSATIVNPANSTDPLWFRIEANDTSDNWLATPWYSRPVADNDPPIFLYDRSSPNATTGDPFTFAAVMDDNIGIMNVSLNTTYNFHRIYIHNMSGSGSSRQLQLVLPSDARGTLHYWYFFEDAAGNTVESPMFNRSVMDNDPPVFLGDLTEGPATTGEFFELGFVAVDNWEIDKAWVKYEMIGLSDSGPVNYSLGRLGNNFTHVIKMPVNWAGVMNYSSFFMDGSGNMVKGRNASVDCLDNDPPGLSEDLTTRIGTTGENITFSIRPKDNIGTKKVLVHYNIFGKGYSSASMRRLEAGQLFNYTLRVPDQEEGAIEYYMTLDDESGNRFITETRQVNIFDNDPPYMIHEGSDSFASTGEIFTFRVAFRDNIGMDHVEVSYSFSGGTGTIRLTLAETLSKGGIYENYLTVPPETTGILSFFYIARDGRSNAFVSPSFQVEIVDVIIPEIVGVRFIDNRTSETSDRLTTGDMYILEMDVRDNLETSEAEYRYWSQGSWFDIKGQMSPGLMFEDRRTYRTEIEVPSNLTGEMRYEITVIDRASASIVTSSGSIPMIDDDPPAIWGLEFSDPVPLVGRLELEFKAWDNIGIREARVYFLHNDTYIRAEKMGDHLYRLVVDYSLNAMEGLRLRVVVSDGYTETVVLLLIKVYDNLPPLVAASLTEGSRYPDDSPVPVVVNVFDHSGWNLTSISIVKGNEGFEIVDYELYRDVITFSFFPPEPGKWVFQLMVEDNNGLYSYIRRNFTIYDHTPPYFQVDHPEKAVKGDLVNLSITNVSDSSAIIWVHWNIMGPEGEIFTYQGPLFIELRPRSAGSYKVTVSLKDQNGNERERSFWFHVEDKSGTNRDLELTCLVATMIMMTLLVGLGVLFLTFRESIIRTWDRITSATAPGKDRGRS
ncbi:MAG: hypothetical protein JW939_01980 [Candidatus Thermoplasmatota archaeon]|nr:hypothetical protein [Candidatus Thermoplasmatota archaeon]